jgi:hypothetical protein
MDDSATHNPNQYISYQQTSQPTYDEVPPPAIPMVWPQAGLPPAGIEVEVMVRPRPDVTRWGWLVVMVAMAGFVICGATVFAGLAGTLFAVALACALTISRFNVRREPIGWLCAAVVVSAGLVLRGSPWLITLNTLAVAGLFVIAALTSRSGSLFRLSRPAFVEGVARSSISWVSGFGLIGSFFSWATASQRRWRRSTSEDLDSSKTRPWRSLLIAAPVLLVVVPLLRAGDAVFNSVVAGFFNAPIRLLESVSISGSTVGNSFLGLWAGLTLLAIAGARPPERRVVRRIGVPQAVRASPGQVELDSKSAKRARLSRDVVGANWILNAVLMVFVLGQVANVLE